MPGKPGPQGKYTTNALVSSVLLPTAVTKAEVARALYASGIKQERIAEILEMNQSTISYLCKRTVTQLTPVEQRKIANPIMEHLALKATTASRLSIAAPIAKEINRILKEIDTNPALVFKSKKEAYDTAIKLAELQRLIEGESTANVQVSTDYNTIKSMVDHAIKNVSNEVENIIDANYDVIEEVPVEPHPPETPVTD